MDNTNDTNNLNSVTGGGAQAPGNKQSDASQAVSDLQKEIQAQFATGTDQPDAGESIPAEPTPNVEVPSQDVSLPSSPSTAPDTDFSFPSVASKRQAPVAGQPLEQTSLADLRNQDTTSVPSAGTPQESEQQTIENLQKDIESQFSAQAPVTPPEAQENSEIPVAPEQTTQQVPENPRKGIGETYYSDLTKAMSANEPRTMSELIQQSSYEKQQQAALSPTSRKNLLYILGTIFFLIISVVAWFLVFGAPETQPEYITKERVNSLVFSDEDLGINITGLQTFEAKSAIRSVVERDHATDTVSQIYYVQEDEMGNLRRLGVKDVFDHTENEVPELLYNNIENEFMHGVYTTDKNYPFIIMKALSYDRAFEGMKEWEPTMIDDLATYFDLPPEAVDRSLLQDGFSDDLIKNKNVRVARYIPREADRRGILDFLRSDGTEFQSTQEGVEPEGEEDPFDTFFEDLPPADDSLSQRVLDILMFPLLPEPVYAQTPGIGGVFISDTTTQGAGTTICYRTNKVCIDLMTGAELPGNTTPSTTVACYDSLVTPSDITEMGETFTPEEVQGQAGYTCRQVLSGGDSITDVSLLYTDPVCFDRFTGDRIRPSRDGTSSASAASSLCYAPYQCKRVACFEGSKEVSSSRAGRPGVSCRATNEIVDHDEDVQKSCVQFNELLQLNNIKNMNLCFDETGSYVPLESRATSLEDYYLNYAGTSQQSAESLMNNSAGVQCISPLTLIERMCVTTTGEVVPGTTTNSSGVEVPLSPNSPNIEFCFEPFHSGDLSDEFNRTINSDVRQKLAAIAQQLERLATLASGYGIFENEVSRKLDEAADIFWQLSVANLLENELIMKVAEVTRTLELILNEVEPLFPNSEVVRELREIIAFIKEVLGFSNNVAWVTIGNDLPTGVNIYPNGQVTGGSLTTAQQTEAIRAVQQSLVLMGLMDPLSVTGELDLVTQRALQTFQEINGFVDGGDALSVDQVFISAETIKLIQDMVNGAEAVYGGEPIANIDTYISETMGLGKYSKDVQQLQIVLYALGYDISGFDGIFDEEVCLAVQQYQLDNGLEVTDTQECLISLATLNSLNETIRENGYLGSGFTVNANGALEGTGAFLGTFGPGTVSFEVSEAEADSLREGDVVLMYTFLDEETILITSHESVITEVVRRRALSDIFNG